MSTADYGQTATDALRGQVPCEILRAKIDAVMTTRVSPRSGPSVIVKYFAGRGPLVSRRAAREWWALRRLAGSGVCVPHAIARIRLRADDRFREALVIEDLGPCRRLSDEASKLDSDALDEIEAALIRMTTGMLRAGVADLDHGAGNVLLPERGAPGWRRVTRVDLECGRRLIAPRLQVGLVAATVARMCGTYLFSVQPDVERAAGLNREMCLALDLSPSMVRRVRVILAGMVERQRAAYGIELDLDALGLGTA